MFLRNYWLDWLHQRLNRKVSTRGGPFHIEVINFGPGVAILIVLKLQKLLLFLIYLVFQTHVSA